MTNYDSLRLHLNNNEYTWLITGVAGFIGSNLLENLLALNQKVVGLDNFSTGFQKIENTLNRILFYQEAIDPLSHLTLSFELNKRYTAEEIGHFRLFRSVYLKEPKLKILSILFGSSDKSNPMRNDLDANLKKKEAGIKYGISGGQWEH